VRTGRRLFLGGVSALDFIVNHGFVAIVNVKVKECGGESNHLSLFVLSILESPTFSNKTA